jgi:WD40 repeat protein
MKRFQSQMQFLKNTKVSARRDVIIQEIEDQAENCFAQITKQKEDLKESVMHAYRVVSEVANWLDTVPALERADNAIAKFKSFQSESEPHPSDIERLSTVKRQITDSGLVEKVDVDTYMASFSKLLLNPTEFVPNEHVYRIGKLVVKTRKNENIKQSKLVFEKEMEVDNKAKYIPCVANLGYDFYAVAHPTTEGVPSNAIDIYKYPGELQRTITDHATPVYDVAPTPDGKLAVLSDGETNDSCSVRLFDPATGDMISSTNIPVRDPIAFDVNIRHQYVILSKDGGKRASVVNEDGSIELSKAVDQSLGIEDFSRIACCSGDTNLVTIYSTICEVMGDRKLPSYCIGCRNKDISTTWFGEVNVIMTNGNKYEIQRSTFHKDGLLERVYFAVGTATIGAQPEARLSVRGNYIVSSQEYTIRVFKDDY